MSLIAEHLRAGHRPDIPVLDDVGIEIARGRTIGSPGFGRREDDSGPGVRTAASALVGPGERGRRRRVGGAAAPPDTRRAIAMLFQSPRQSTSPR